jgi:hypothetical protein
MDGWMDGSEERILEAQGWGPGMQETGPSRDMYDQEH